MLPDVYQECEYLEGGVPYIEYQLYYVADEPLSIDFVFSFPYLTTANNLWAAGNSSLALGNYRQVEFGWYTGWWNAGGGISYKAIGGSGRTAIMHSSFSGTPTRTGNAKFPLFTRATSDSLIDKKPASNTQLTTRIYSFSVSENNEPVTNLVPCWRISDDKPGMYDTVSNTFLVNQGDGDDFICGPAVYHHSRASYALDEMDSRRRALISATLGGGLPSGYQRVEYLESTSGANQWIDTGIVPTIDTGIELVKRYSSGSYLNNYLGVGENVSNQYQVSAGDVRFDGLSKDTTALRPAGTILIWHRILYFNGEQIFNFTNATDSIANITLTLWCKHSNSTSTVRYSVAKFCSFKMWDANDKLVLNLIPCYRKSDNKPGMYDTVSKQFLVNQGTGADFTLGPNV